MKLTNKTMGTIVMTIVFVFFLAKAFTNPTETIQRSIALNSHDSAYTLISHSQTRTNIVELNELKHEVSSSTYAGRLIPFQDQDTQSYVLLAKKQVYLYEKTPTAAQQIFSSRHSIFFTNLVENQELYYITRITDAYLFCHMDDCKYFSAMNLRLEDNTLQFTTLNVLGDNLYITTIGQTGDHVVYIVDLETHQFVSKHSIAGDLFVHDGNLYALQQESINDEQGVSTLVFNSTHHIVKYDAKLNKIEKIKIDGLSEGYLSFLKSDMDTMYFMNTLDNNETEIIAYDIKQEKVIQKITIPALDDQAILSSDIIFDFVAHKIAVLSNVDSDGYTYQVLNFKLETQDTITSKERLVDIIFH